MSGPDTNAPKKNELNVAERFDAAARHVEHVEFEVAMNAVNPLMEEDRDILIELAK